MNVKLSPKPPNAAFRNFLTSLTIEESFQIDYQNCPLEFQFAIMQESYFFYTQWESIGKKHDVVFMR